MTMRERESFRSVIKIDWNDSIPLIFFNIEGLDIA